MWGVWHHAGPAPKSIQVNIKQSLQDVKMGEQERYQVNHLEPSEYFWGSEATQVLLCRCFCRWPVGGV